MKIVFALFQRFLTNKNVIIRNGKEISTMYKLMLIEDDLQLSKLIQENLERYSYQVIQPEGFSNIVEEFTTIKPDLVLLDINLPYYDGFFLCRSFRKLSNVPIIIISARSQEMDQIMAIEFGADDYITKPFSPFPLLARIKAILRRAQVPPANEENREHVIRGDHYQILLDTHEVTLNEKNIEGLTAKEFELLTFMAKHEKHVFSREQLIERLWGFDFPGDERTVDAHIKRLRKKIHTPPYSWIHTIWGVGYKFDGDVRDED